jgi:hypothetical protein
VIYLAKSRANSVDLLLQRKDKIGQHIPRTPVNSSLVSLSIIDFEKSMTRDATYDIMRGSSSINSMATSTSYYSHSSTTALFHDKDGQLSVPPTPCNSSIRFADDQTTTNFNISQNGHVTFALPARIPHAISYQDRNRPSKICPLKFWKSKNTKHHLSPIDLAGYKFLARPLRIEYSNILSSWRFSDEIAARKMTVRGCTDYACRGRGDCRHEKVKRKWIGLDDASTWVMVDQVVTRAKKRQLFKRPTNILKEKKRGEKQGVSKEVLFEVDWTSEDKVVMRKLSVDDEFIARVELDEYEGHFICPEENEQEYWMKIVRYFEADRILKMEETDTEDEKA